MKNFWQDIKKIGEPFLALAPMEGVTDFVFRDIISDLAKPDVLFTEFTSAESLDSLGYDKTIPRLKFSEKQRPIVAQIWGVSPRSFEKAARIVQELGFDGIDINMGCPDKNVLRRGAGANLITNPPLTTELISAIRTGAPNMPLSIKTRLGFNKVITEEWITFLLEHKIEALTIHGRTAKQLSKVDANWEEIKKSVEIKSKVSPSTIVIGNGDVFTYADSIRRYEESGVDGVMIGRGIFHDPFLFEKNVNGSSHTTKEHLELLLTHSKLFYEYWQDSKNFAEMRRFFKIYVKSFRGATKLKVALMETQNYDEVEKLIKPVLNSLS